MFLFLSKSAGTGYHFFIPYIPTKNLLIGKENWPWIQGWSMNILYHRNCAQPWRWPNTWHMSPYSRGCWWRESIFTSNWSKCFQLENFTSLTLSLDGVRSSVQVLRTKCFWDLPVRWMGLQTYSSEYVYSTKSVVPVSWKLLLSRISRKSFKLTRDKFRLESQMVTMTVTKGAREHACLGGLNVMLHGTIVNSFSGTRSTQTVSLGLSDINHMHLTSYLVDISQAFHWLLWDWSQQPGHRRMIWARHTTKTSCADHWNFQRKSYATGTLLTPQDLYTLSGTLVLLLADVEVYFFMVPAFFSSCPIKVRFYTSSRAPHYINQNIFLINTNTSCGS